ncbi:hypothetical protein [Psychroserpens algicola]|uniref:hypothetical protein n=1 Tax=Psychroserpens algicola TaxID=1719034 RepID=UPI00195318D6|nr:hypothetical protein [Psychroserpens algicola]
MKSINSKLFEKKINLEASNVVFGGRRSSTASSETTHTGPNGNQDEQTTHYDEDCNITMIEICWN